MIPEDDYEAEARRERRAIGWSHFDALDDIDVATARGLGSRGPADFADDTDPSHMEAFMFAEFAQGHRRPVAMLYPRERIIEAAVRVRRKHGQPYGWEPSNRERLYNDIVRELEVMQDPREDLTIEQVRVWDRETGEMTHDLGRQVIGESFTAQLAKAQEEWMDADIKAQTDQARLLRAIGRVPGI
jgi:hypothetical protein